MTSQEHEVKRRSRVARIWQNRRQRWAAWRAARQADFNKRSHNELAMHWSNEAVDWLCPVCGLGYSKWEERSCAVVRHTTL